LEKGIIYACIVDHDRTTTFLTYFHDSAPPSRV